MIQCHPSDYTAVLSSHYLDMKLQSERVTVIEFGPSPSEWKEPYATRAYGSGAVILGQSFFRGIDVTTVCKYKVKWKVYQDIRHP